VCGFSSLGTVFFFWGGVGDKAGRAWRDTDSSPGSAETVTEPQKRRGASGGKKTLTLDTRCQNKLSKEPPKLRLNLPKYFLSLRVTVLSFLSSPTGGRRNCAPAEVLRPMVGQLGQRNMVL
jgi:hypothetical protein